MLFYDATHSNAVKYAIFLLKNDLEVELHVFGIKSWSETHYISWHLPFSSSSVTMMKVFTTSFFSRKGQRLAAGVVPPPARVSTASWSTYKGTSCVYISTHVQSYLPIVVTQGTEPKRTTIDRWPLYPGLFVWPIWLCMIELIDIYWCYKSCSSQNVVLHIIHEYPH